MTVTDAAIDLIALRDCPAVRRLVHDLFEYARENGEAAGLELAAVLRDGIRRYDEHEKRILGRTGVTC